MRLVCILSVLPYCLHLFGAWGFVVKPYLDPVNPSFLGFLIFYKSLKGKVFGVQVNPKPSNPKP